MNKNRPEAQSETETESEDSFSDEVRRKYYYRKLVINGKTKIPARLAMKMVGPDCAFHLYRNHDPEK